MPSPLGLIAGAGRFPFHVAREAKRQGIPVIAVGIHGWADGSLAEHVDTYEEIAIGQLGRLIAYLKSHDIHQAIMAGKVTKEVLLNERSTFDAEARHILRQAAGSSVGVLLGSIGTRLASEGITLLDSSTFLKRDLCPAGVLTSRGPTATEQEGIEVGLHAAQTIATLDIGQTVIVKGKVVVAVEALEGTDAAIRRAYALAGKDLVVVKMASPDQDRRFDLPIIGPDTIATFSEAGVSCLAVEAGTTLLLDREALIASANAAKLCLIGVALP